MLRNEATDSTTKQNLRSVMRLAQCSVELQNVQVSDTTEV